MGRIFRVWVKKRGHRQTGSPLVAGLGETLFFGLLFMVGSALLARVISSQLIHPTPEIYRPGFGFWLTVLVLGSFVVIGGWGVFRTVLQLGASVERRSVMASRAAGIDLLRDALARPQDCPTVPRDAQLTNSPGVTLAFRLPVAQSSTWKLSFATLFSLVSVGLTSVLLVAAVDSHLRGNPEWSLTVFLVPLLGVDGWALAVFFRELWEHTRIGPTCVEISDHPLRPGREYAIHLSQAGRLSLRGLEMCLVCEEEATFRQGTDIRRETRVVKQERIFARQEVRATPGFPLEVRESLRVPDGAMHSFQSAHNAVRWKLVLKGQPESGPEFVRSFPVIVYPPGGAAAAQGGARQPWNH